jgi:hypothetical protein
VSRPGALPHILLARRLEGQHGLPQFFGRLFKTPEPGGLCKAPSCANLSGRMGRAICRRPKHGLFCNTLATRSQERPWRNNSAHSLPACSVVYPSLRPLMAWSSNVLLFSAAQSIFSRPISAPNPLWRGWGPGGGRRRSDRRTERTAPTGSWFRRFRVREGTR